MNEVHVIYLLLLTVFIALLYKPNIFLLHANVYYNYKTNRHKRLKLWQSILFVTIGNEEARKECTNDRLLLSQSQLATQVTILYI